MQNNRSLSRWWLLTGVLGLAVAGIFAVVLVVARTPVLSSIPLFSNLFHSSLVVHVDLSVLVWFLCIACLFWSRAVAAVKSPISYIEEAAIGCMLGGIIFIALSPLDFHAPAIMSNYIPVITSPVFFFGLALVSCGIFLMAIRTLFAIRHVDYPISTSVLILLLSLAAFVLSYLGKPEDYNTLFWGGGHVLQYLHTQMLLMVWLMLVAAINPGFTLKEGVRKALFFIGPVAALVAMHAYLAYEVNSTEHHLAFTDNMIAFGGIATIIVAVIIFPQLWAFRNARMGENRALWAALLVSMLLFLYGGVLGHMIRGQNVIIPAHYHGSIIGITIAFMGAAYALLPQFGYRKVAGWKLAYWQPIIYGFGQALHISGLAWSGGYGVLRKTPGALESGVSAAKVAMGLMGGGGLIAIIGGLMFVVVVGMSVLVKPKPSFKSF